MLPSRLRRLPELSLPDGRRGRVAVSWRSRLLGLALLDSVPADAALLIPRCRSIHTFGMRFAIDVTFVDAHGNPVRIARAVPGRRVLRCARAAAVIEEPASG